MKTHEARCVTKGTARRLMSLGRCAVGYPLPSGEWSIQGGPFADGDNVRLRLMSRNGGKTYAEIDAVVRDCSIDGRRVFVAHFTPIS